MSPVPWSPVFMGCCALSSKKKDEWNLDVAEHCSYCAKSICKQDHIFCVALQLKTHHMLPVQLPGSTTATFTLWNKTVGFQMVSEILDVLLNLQSPMFSLDQHSNMKTDVNPT